MANIRINLTNYEDISLKITYTIFFSVAHLECSNAILKKRWKFYKIIVHHIRIVCKTEKKKCKKIDCNSSKVKTRKKSRMKCKNQKSLNSRLSVWEGFHPKVEYFWFHENQNIIENFTGEKKNT